MRNVCLRAFVCVCVLAFEHLSAPVREVKKMLI